MTQGVFEVSGIYPAALSKEEVVEYAACAESYSSHPISKSLQKAYGKQIHRDRVTEIEVLPHRLTADWLLQETESSWISLEFRIRYAMRLELWFT